MTSSRFVRGTKGRLFACLGALTVFAGVIFLYHSTRVELDEVRNGASKCRQEQESLAAQLQVIFEYKKRLEKSLQQEKADHRQTKEELQSRMNDEQQLRDKENLENVNKYTALQQQYKLLQSQHEDLSEKLAKIQSSRDTCEENLHRQQTQTASMQLQLATKEKELEDLKAYKLKADKENKDLQIKLSHLESEIIKTRKQVQDQKMEMYVQAEQQKRESIWKNRTSSTKEVDTGHIEDSAGGSQGGNIAPPQRAPPAAPSSSLAAQVEQP